MGFKKKTEKVEWSEEKIIDVLERNFLSQPKYVIRNLYVFDKSWESDYLAMTKSGYLYEGEVKISRADFKADMKKKRKHQILEGTYEPKMIQPWGKEAYTEKVLKPNYFFYAVPEGLIEPEEVPEYAGLVYMCDVWPYVKWVKNAPKIHGEKLGEDDLNLCEKFYYNMVSWRNKAINDYKRELDVTRQLLKEAKTDEDGNKYPHTAGEYKKMYEALIKEKIDSEKYREQLFGEVLALRSENRILKRENERLKNGTE